MARNLRHQAHHAISKCISFGADKHSMKTKTASGKLALEDTHHIFSKSQKEALNDLANQIAGFMKEKHPDIKILRDITSEHLNEFLDSKASSCSTELLLRIIANASRLRFQGGTWRFWQCGSRASHLRK